MKIANISETLQLHSKSIAQNIDKLGQAATKKMQKFSKVGDNLVEKTNLKSV
jgi:hypothetical protein